MKKGAGASVRQNKSAAEVSQRLIRPAKKGKQIVLA